MFLLFVIPFFTTVLGFIFGFKTTGMIDEETGGYIANIPAILGTTMFGCLAGLLALYILII